MWIAISNAIGQRVGTGGGPGPGPGPDPVPSLPGGFAAAYSVRKLDSSYSGSCLEAYRVSDGATQDIGFDGNGDLDTAAIISFAGGGEVRVRTWYDQSGNGVDATQTTDTFMPRIYDGAAIYEENGKPTLAWTVQGQHMDTTPNESITAQSNFVVFNMDSTSGGFARVLAQAETGQDDYFAGQYSALLKSPTVNSLMATYDGNAAPEVLNSSAYNNQHLWTAIANGTESDVWLDSGTEGSASTTLSSSLNMANLTIRTIGGAAGFNQDRLVGNIQEVLIYNTDQDSSGNRYGIEYNINDYYSVFNSVNPMPASSSGLLYDYSGAAAAYSVRSLSNNAVKCMRVRRTVAPFDEQDIGFDSNGDLDTSAIATFGGSDPLTVSRWYDQSGNQNHATQATAGSQPSIYDGSTVSTENGKPSLQFYGATNKGLTTPLAPVHNTRYWLSAVNKITGNSVPFAATNNAYLGQSISGGTGSPTSSQFGSTTYYVDGNALSSPTQGDLYNEFINTQGLLGIDFTWATTYVATTYEVGGYSWYSNNTFQEFILWDSDQTSNRTGIESNINGYFNVYTEYNPDAPTSGFLFDYSGAAVAYSVRQLNDNATYAMRVRRTVAPFDEQDIGFDGSGNLDTTAISTFGGSDSLTVSRWYDQTGNQNHATQGTAGSQPQIYDGAAVITENGNPAIKFTYESGPTLSRLDYYDISATRFYHVWVMNQATNKRLNWMNNGSGNYYRMETSGQMYLIKPNDFDNAFGDIGLTGYKLRSIDRDSDATATAYVDGSSSNAWTGLDPSAFTFGRVDGKFVTSAAGYHLNIQEFIIYDSSQSSNRTGIESNINTYYSIY